LQTDTQYTLKLSPEPSFSHKTMHQIA